MADKPRLEESLWWNYAGWTSQIQMQLMMLDRLQSHLSGINKPSSDDNVSAFLQHRTENLAS